MENPQVSPSHQKIQYYDLMAWMIWGHPRDLWMCQNHSKPIIAIGINIISQL